MAALLTRPASSHFPERLRAELKHRLTQEQWSRLDGLASSHPEIFAQVPPSGDTTRWIHAVSASLNVYATDCLSLKDYDGAEQALRLSLEVNPNDEAPDTSFDAHYGMILVLKQKGRLSEIPEHARLALKEHDEYSASLGSLPQSAQATDKLMARQLRLLARKK